MGRLLKSMLFPLGRIVTFHCTRFDVREMAKKETTDATINLNSPMFPCFRKAVLLIAVFWEAALSEAALLEAALSIGSAYDDSTFRGLCFWEAVLLITAFWEAAL